MPREGECQPDGGGAPGARRSDQERHETADDERQHAQLDRYRQERPERGERRGTARRSIARRGEARAQECEQEPERLQGLGHEALGVDPERGGEAEHRGGGQRRPRPHRERAHQGVEGDQHQGGDQRVEERDREAHREHAARA